MTWDLNVERKVWQYRSRGLRLKSHSRQLNGCVRCPGPSSIPKRSLRVPRPWEPPYPDFQKVGIFVNHHATLPGSRDCTSASSIDARWCRLKGQTNPKAEMILTFNLQSLARALAFGVVRPSNHNYGHHTLITQLDIICSFIKTCEVQALKNLKYKKPAIHTRLC